MNDIIDKLFVQVVSENCSEPLYRFARLVAAQEREACARLCEELSQQWYDEGGSASDCATAIRARGDDEL